MAYQIGETVRYYHYDAIVVALVPNSHPPECKIEFFDKTLIPPVMRVPEHTLTRVGDPWFDIHDADECDNFELDIDFSLPGLNKETKKIDTKTHCPDCGTPWTETVFGTKSWFDCIPCNKTKETILNGK